jgi:hypothetical protein
MIMWGLIVLSCVFVLVLGIAAVADLRAHDRGFSRGTRLTARKASPGNGR